MEEKEEGGGRGEREEEQQHWFVTHQGLASNLTLTNVADHHYSPAE